MPDKNILSPEGWVVTDAYNVTKLEGLMVNHAFIIIGPHEMGAQAILQEGGWIQAPRVTNPELELGGSDSDFQISRNGLRHVIWAYTEDEIPSESAMPDMSEQDRRLLPTREWQPESIALIGLIKAVSILKENSPSHVEFMEQSTIQRIHHLLMLTRQDASGRYPSLAGRSAEALQDLVLDATKAFGAKKFKEIVDKDNEEGRDLNEKYGSSEEEYQPWRVPTTEEIERIKASIKEQDDA